MTVSYLVFGDKIQISQKMYWNLSHPDVLDARFLINNALPRVGSTWTLFQDPVQFFEKENFVAKPLVSLQRLLSKKLNAFVHIFVGRIKSFYKTLIASFELKMLNASVWADVFGFTELALNQDFRLDQKSLRIFLDQFDDQNILEPNNASLKQGLNCMDCTFSLLDVLNFGVPHEIYRRFDLVSGSFLLAGLPEVFFVAANLDLPSSLINQFLQPTTGYCFAVELILANLAHLKEKSAKNCWFHDLKSRGFLKNDYVSILKTNYERVKFLVEWLKERGYFVLSQKRDLEGTVMIFRNEALNRLLSCPRTSLDFKNILSSC